MTAYSDDWQRYLGSSATENVAHAYQALRRTSSLQKDRLRENPNLTGCTSLDYRQQYECSTENIHQYLRRHHHCYQLGGSFLQRTGVRYLRRRRTVTIGARLKQLGDLQTKSWFVCKLRLERMDEPADNLEARIPGIRGNEEVSVIG